MMPLHPPCSNHLASTLINNLHRGTRCGSDIKDPAMPGHNGAHGREKPQGSEVGVLSADLKKHELEIYGIDYDFI